MNDIQLLSLYLEKKNGSIKGDLSSVRLYWQKAECEGKLRNFRESRKI
jgi:hypothetical protein